VGQSKSARDFVQGDDLNVLYLVFREMVDIHLMPMGDDSKNTSVV
jgi:hypothetical protein